MRTGRPFLERGPPPRYCRNRLKLPCQWRTCVGFAALGHASFEAQTTSKRLDHQADFLSPAERSNAIHSVDLCCSQMVKIAIIIGRPIKAPAIPQRKLQKNTASRTMNGDIDKAAPAIRGSR